jgi:hypothetical protein
MATASTSSIINLDDDNSSSSKKTSPVYQFFTYKNSRWCCNHCSKDFGDKANSTLWRHLKSNHPRLHQEIKKQEGEEGGEGEEIVGEMDKFVTTTKNKMENVSKLFIFPLMLLTY